ncbi:MAG: PAS domain S-box protein, partial [Deltaproteobacteria bacterium]|nr:PAS domain S-box protein [Candidatus Anaeroferrophillacea bacterium]
CWDFFLGHGIVGGMLVSGFAQGEAAAAMAGSILDGEPVKDIPVQHASPNRFMFDYRQLQRFGIGTSHVPADSVVVNRPFSFYQVYAGRIWCAAGVFAGMILLLVFLSVTIFRRRRAERALRESEGRLQTVFDAARTVSLVITDSAGADARIREFSPGAERIFGCSRAEVLGQPVAVFHRPGDVSRFPEIVESLRQNRSGFDGETVLVRKNGEQFPALFSIHPIFGSDDRLVALLEVSIDITLLHEARKSLEASERHFRELFDSVSDLVFTHDLEGRFLTVNRAIAETFGGAPEEFIGRRVTEYMPAEFRHLFEPEYLAPLRRDGRAAGINGYLDHRGGKVYVEYHCTMVRPEDGAPYVSGIGRNVTERMRAERQLKQLRQKVLQAEKMEAIGVLAGGIAHDFNNLLMGIQGNASLMLLGRKPGDADYEKLRHIEQYVQNGAALTKQLLGFARGGKYEVKPTDLNELIRDHGRMFGRTKKEITIHERFAADLQPVEVDQGQMEQCLLNLYINAWQAMPGGGEIYVQTENVVLDERYVMPFSVPPGKYVKVTVTDTGTGMDEATRKRIFESFFTTREMGRGTGLGLASVYGIIQNHGGMINVYSEKGTGTTFTIYLPAGGRDAVTVSSPVVDMDDLLRGTETVLLVDDEPMIIEVGKGMLEVLGYRVLTAASAGEALEIYAANRERIALVILDMIMPGMGGGEAHERLKAIYPWVKTLLSSGYSLNGQAQKIIDRGCRGFIQKPFKIVELARKVREILDG